LTEYPKLAVTLYLPRVREINVRPGRHDKLTTLLGSELLKKLFIIVKRNSFFFWFTNDKKIKVNVRIERAATYLYHA
jgi:hypothetical protein